MLLYVPRVQATADDKLVGAIVCKAEARRGSGRIRGYVAMLAVDAEYRKCGIGSALATIAMRAMAETCDEVSAWAVVLPLP